VLASCASLLLACGFRGKVNGIPGERENNSGRSSPSPIWFLFLFA
jgi:hypothetical protein